MRKLIVTADDFGAVDSIDDGIIHSIQHGIVNTVSAFSTFPDFEERIQRFKSFCPDTPIGLHLNLTAGKALVAPSNSPLTDKNGFFWELPNLLRRLSKIPLADVEKEIEAQIQRAKAVIEVDHLSCHMNVMCFFRPYFELYLNLAQKYKLSLRTPNALSQTYPKRFKNCSTKKKALKCFLGFISRSPIQALKISPHLVPSVLAKQNEKVHQLNIPSPNHLCDAFYGQPNLEHLFEVLHILPPGTTELLTHPALPSKAPYPNGIEEAYKAFRLKELECLCKSDIKDFLQEHQFELTQFPH